MPDQRLRNMDDLVNRVLVRAWLWWAIVWLTVFPLVGLLVSIKFPYPDFLGETSWLTFGRLRPVHVNGVIFGAFSTPVLGLLYYLHPVYVYESAGITEREGRVPLWLVVVSLMIWGPYYLFTYWNAPISP